tara:strand:- start:1030 stop:2022 length:993 start_codon:yes stop_codon:yes gene_type:complete
MLPSSIKTIELLIPKGRFLENRKVLKEELSIFLTKCIEEEMELPASYNINFGPLELKFDVLTIDNETVVKTTIVCNTISNRLNIDQINSYREVVRGTDQTIMVKCPENKKNEWYEYTISSKKYKECHLRSITTRRRVLKSVLEREKRMRANPFGNVLISGNRGASIVSKDTYRILSPIENENKKKEPLIKKKKNQPKGRSLKDLDASSFFKGKGRSRKWGSSTTTPSDATPAKKKYVPPGRRSTKEIQNSIVLMNLPNNITKKDIQGLFEQFGYIHNIHILYDRYDTTRAFKAFVNFALEEEARAAVSSKGSIKLSSRIIDIQMSKSKKK